MSEVVETDHENYIQPFELTQQQAKLLALLMEVQVASADTIHKRVGMATEAKVAIHRLRQRLKKFDVNISAMRFRGFWITAEDKEKVKSVMGA